MLFRSDELGHSRTLELNRNGSCRPIQDPSWIALSDWFSYKIQTLNDLERATLMHLVLEQGRRIFHDFMHPITKPAKKAKTSKASKSDSSEKIDFDFLHAIDQQGIDHLFSIIDQGWDMLNALYERTAELSIREI